MRRREYLTLWTGYPLEEATWEPEENFDDREALLRSLKEENLPEEVRIDQGRSISKGE